MTLAQTVGDRLFRQGDSGDIVRTIQLALAALGYGLKGTGFFGGATDAAVTAFQRRAGVKADGVVGAATAKAIDHAAAVTSSKEAPTVTLEIGRPLWLIYGLTLLGTKEVPGTGDNKVILDWAKDEGGDIAKSYTHDSIPFCALFENHIFTKVGIKGTETLWALDWAGKWPSIKLPGIAVGAVAPMLRNGGGHVITVVGKDQHGNVMGLGSNQSDTTSVIPFPLSRLNQGFWWPISVNAPAVTGMASLPIVKSDGKVSTKDLDMADDTKTGIKDAICNMNVKAGLAFFLIMVAALMVLIMMICVLAFNVTVDPGMAALLASFITMFIKMAADASGYQYTSSAGSEKKDEVTAATNLKLAEKVGPNSPASTAPVPPWWSRMNEAEKNAITSASAGDPRVAAFVTASQVGAATADDLTYLVTKGLLTQDRATAIAAT